MNKRLTWLVVVLIVVILVWFGVKSSTREQAENAAPVSSVITPASTVAKKPVVQTYTTNKSVPAAAAPAPAAVTSTVTGSAAQNQTTVTNTAAQNQTSDATKAVPVVTAVNPKTATINNNITITGTGFSPSQEVQKANTVTLEDTTGYATVKISVVFANAKGTSIDLTLPINMYSGTYKVIVKNEFSGISSTQPVMLVVNGSTPPGNRALGGGGGGSSGSGAGSTPAPSGTPQS
jgi:hypothetical protein